MLKMMTYQEANNILYTKLIPDEYCICKKTAIDNGADLDAFFTTNSTQVFPNNRLVPVDGISNESQPSSCFLPIDDMTMVLAGYDGDPGKSWHSFGGTYPGGNNDIGAAGWTYSIDRIIMDNGRVILNSNNASTMEVGPSAGNEWLKITVNSEPTNISVRGAEPAPSDNHFSFRGGYLSYEVLQYRIKANTGDYRTAKIVMKAVKNTSLWNDLETAATNNDLQLAENVCSTFVVTVRQRAAAGYDNGEGKKLAEFSNIESGNSITLACNSTSGTELDLAVWGAGSSSGAGYWSSVTGQEGIDDGDTIGIHDFRNVVQFSGSGNSKTITISPSALDAQYDSGTAPYSEFFVFASWAGCANSSNGMPPQPITGSCNITVSGTDSFVTSGTGFEYESGTHNTFNVQVSSASALNLKPSFANANQIKERGSCILHIKYRIGGQVNGQDGIHDLIVKRVDATNDYYSTYIKPLFYISDSTWAGNTDTNRNYTAKSGTVGSTGSIQLYSTVNSRNAGYIVSMCDSTGQAVTSDTSTYSLTVGSTTKSITSATSAKFDAAKNSTLTIDFTNVVKGTGPETKYFKIEQVQGSTIPGISENMSPEFAIIGFTFN